MDNTRLETTYHPVATWIRQYDADNMQFTTSGKPRHNWAVAWFYEVINDQRILSLYVGIQEYDLPHWLVMA